ncbi:hypothetical protein ACN27F_04280 [Solwaraspora sp. WMMB335]|uniref:hypothetical protein n=1 Tax=Solwaraspora sp. WMMB335 TaxID=3404118 RepID=UPI003B957D09
MAIARRALTATALAGALLFATAGAAAAAPVTAPEREAGAVVQADDWILRNVYSDQAFCIWYAGYGVDNGLWTQWRCERTVFGTSVYYFLWTN